jgi:16S rRNA (guanine527-N7)-methyltransferase
MVDKSLYAKARQLYQRKEIERLGISPEPEQRSAIITYFALILKWNDTVGLVSKNDIDDIFVRHFCDSLQPLLLFGFKKNARVLDVGSGAGFAAIPIKILRPDIAFVMVESRKKKCSFLREVKEVLAFEHMTILNDRIETMEPPREKFDYALSRGVGPLRRLAKLVYPYIDKGSRLYSYQTKNFMKEIEEITQQKEKEGYRVSEIAEYDLGRRIFDLKIVALEPL